MLLGPLNAADTQLLLSSVRLQTRAAIPSSRAWIYDGLAGYAQAAYMQEEKGRPAAIAYLRGHLSALIAAEKENAQRGSDQAGHSLINDPDETYVQAKSMAVWWMLRDTVGEQALTAAMHNYKASDDTNVYYMQKLLAAQGHRDLSWFFDDWVYRDRGLPELRIVSAYPRQLVSGVYMVTIKVENIGEAGAEVPVTLHMAEGQATERLVVPGKSKASVRIVAPMLPDEAVVNDGSVPEPDTTNNTFTIETTH
jgi:aminopeptidase N